jgi:hypothetical protein
MRRDDSHPEFSVSYQIELAVCNLFAARKSEKLYKAHTTANGLIPEKSARHLPINRPAARALKR